MSQSIPSPSFQQIHAWGARLCPHKLSWGAGFDGSVEVAKILHTGLIRTQNRFFSIHTEYETGTDTVALTTKTFMHLCLFKRTFCLQSFNRLLQVIAKL